MSAIFSRAEVLARVAALGFSAAGIVPAETSPHLDAYFAWLAAGYHAGLYYMERPDRTLRRRNIQAVLPRAASIISVALDYRAEVDPALLSDPSRGRISTYAWGLDYHAVLRDRLRALAADLKKLNEKANIYVDYGALLERSHAERAGMGFIGKNTMLIHPRRGSLFFLGEIITTAAFDDYDSPLNPSPACGRCTRCLNNCPTQAFPRPFVLDANRCISYHTIENAGWIPRSLRGNFGNWVFGCDICQEVCPWNRFAPISGDSAFPPPPIHRAAPRLIDLLNLTEATYQTWYGGAAVAQIGHERLIRNACVAAGNSADTALIPALRGLTHHANPFIRGHAAWTLWRLGDLSSVNRLIFRETDDGVLSELSQLIDSSPIPESGRAS